MTHATAPATKISLQAVNTGNICAIAKRRIKDKTTYSLLSQKAATIIDDANLQVTKAQLTELLASYNHSDLGINDSEMIDRKTVSEDIPEIRSNGQIRAYTQNIRSHNNRGALSDNQWALIQESHQMFDDKSFVELTQEQRIQKKHKLKSGRLQNGTILNETEKLTDQQIDTLLYYTICGKSWIRIALLGAGIAFGGMYIWNKVTSSNESNKAPEPNERRINKENQEAAPIDTLPKFNEQAFREAMENTDDESFLQIGSHANNFNYGVSVEDKGDMINFFGRSDYSSFGSFPYSFARGYSLEDVTRDLKFSFDQTTSTIEIDVNLPPFKLQDFKAIDSLGWHQEKQTDVRSKFGGTERLETLHGNVRNDARHYIKGTLIPSYVRMNIPQQTLKSIKGIGPWVSFAARAAVSNGRAKTIIVRVKYPVAPFSPDPMKKQRKCGNDGKIVVDINYTTEIDRVKVCSGGYVTRQHTRKEGKGASYNIIENQLEYGQFIRD